MRFRVESLQFRALGRDVSREKKMALRGTDSVSYITVYTSVRRPFGGLALPDPVDDSSRLRDHAILRACVDAGVCCGAHHLRGPPPLRVCVSGFWV